MPEQIEELLTAEEAAGRLGVTRSYLYRLIKRGVVPEAVGIRNGREVKLIPASALERLDAAEGLLVRDVGAGERWNVSDLAMTAAGVAGGAEPVTGRSPDSDERLLLLSELRAEVRALREQLAAERAARQELQGRLENKAPTSDALVTAISRANEVTALVKASEFKQNRILEELIAQRRWGRAKRIGYAIYLVVMTAVGIAAVILILKMASSFQALLER